MPLKISDYRVLFDRQADGYRASSGMCEYHQGTLRLAFIYASDGAAGQPQYLVESNDLGHTWTEPVLFGPAMENPKIECQTVGFASRSKLGTCIITGFHLPLGVRENHPDADDDIIWRASSTVIGRQPVGADKITWTKIPSGTFMSEQFTHNGITLQSGRLIAQTWGAAKKGENWQAGVILSDDDGVTWRYRQVAYNSDPAIRAVAKMTAGYNEQTLFELPDGELVSIIRGRERLGATDASLVESYYFRSSSRDGGETWSFPALTNLAGTGAPSAGITLPDGSLLLPNRIPATVSPRWIKPPDPQHKGLHLARSFDRGQTWQTEAMIQHQPNGKLYNNYYNAMNGYFVTLAPNRWLYTFGHFDYVGNGHRVMSFQIEYS